MSVRIGVRWGLGVLVAVATATVLGVAPARADDTVVVRGTDFPDPVVQLSFVGCTSLYDRTDEPLQPRVGRGPDLPPAGFRSLGYDLTGGNAMGALFTVPSLAGTTTASLAVHAPGGASGVAYAGYQDPADAGTDQAWFGRAELTAPAGVWHIVDAALLPYVWTKYDMATGQALEAGPATASSVSEFTAAHGGDAAGLYTVGFGCDGNPFSMDALRVGAPGRLTTYDLEGLTTATSMVGDHAVIDADESIELHGSLEGQVPHASLVLEQRSPGSDAWLPVEVVEADAAHATVAPDQRTLYRWRFADRPLAEGSVSAPFLVEVAPVLTAEVVDGQVVGSATPVLPGAQVTLRDLQGAVVVDRAPVDATGAFSLALPEGAGHYVVTLPPTSGNLGAASAPFAVPAQPTEAAQP